MRYRSHSVLLVLFALAAAGAGPVHLHGQDPEEALRPAASDAIRDSLAAPGAVTLPVPGPSLAALQFPGPRADAAPLRPLHPMANLDRRLAERERFTPNWIYVGLGAALGGALGFTLAAASCLDGSTDCGTRTLTYALVGTLTGGVAGLVVGIAGDR